MNFRQHTISSTFFSPTIEQPFQGLRTCTKVLHYGSRTVQQIVDHDRLQQKDILIQFGMLRKLLLSYHMTSYDLLRIIPNWYLFPKATMTSFQTAMTLYLWYGYSYAECYITCITLIYLHVTCASP